MRDEGGAVVEVSGGWAVQSFDLAVEVIRDPERWSSDRFDGPVPEESERWLAELTAEAPELAELLAVPLQTLVALDPPDHGRLRKVLVPFFGAAAIRRLEPLVTAQVDALLDELLAAPGPVELVGEYAAPLPFRVVALLFGLPEPEWPEFRRLAEEANGDDPQNETKEKLRVRLGAELELMRYFAARIEGRGGDADTEGLLAGLRGAVAAGTISLREATGLCREVLVAGADSTGNHLAAGVLALARDPALAGALRADPPRLEPFVEEVLRLEPPFKGFWRRATRATRLGGVDIPAGGLVLLPYPALNRDPGRFDRGEEIVLDRPSPRRHLTFGQGIHFCIGAPLARLQSTATFSRLLARTERIELAVPASELRYKPSPQIGGLEALPVRLAGSGELRGVRREDRDGGTAPPTTLAAAEPTRVARGARSTPRSPTQFAGVGRRRTE